MELRVMKYFLMVSQEENITKAAQLLLCHTADAFKATYAA